MTVDVANRERPHTLEQWNQPKSKLFVERWYNQAPNYRGIDAIMPEFGSQPVFMDDKLDFRDRKFMIISNHVLPRLNYALLAVHGPRINLGILGQGPYGRVNQAQALRSVGGS